MVSHPGRGIDFSRCLNENVRASSVVRWIPSAYGANSKIRLVNSLAALLVFSFSVPIGNPMERCQAQELTAQANAIYSSASTLILLQPFNPSWPA